MSVAILLGLDGNKVNAARVALGAVAPNPFRSLELENMFLNKAMEEIDVDEVIARSSMVVSQALGNRPSAKWKNEAIKGLMRQVLSKIGIM